MRVVAGRLGGLNFDAPKSHRTHPMSEKMRGAVFSALGDIEGLSILDAFGGSGSISYEAISRRAKDSQVVEIDKSSFDVISRNIDKLKLASAIKATRANVSGWSDNNPDKKFDIVFCNPPFDNLKSELIDKLSKHVKDTGLLVLSWPGDQALPTLLAMRLVQDKDYGDAQLAFYKKTG